MKRNQPSKLNGLEMMELDEPIDIDLYEEMDDSEDEYWIGDE